MSDYLDSQSSTGARLAPGDGFTPAAALIQLDSLITDLDHALAEANTARLVISDAEGEQAIIEASVSLSIEGKNETARKALLTLALRDDLGYRELSRTSRDARTALLDAERRIAVLKERIRLVRAALALHIGAERADF